MNDVGYFVERSERSFLPNRCETSIGELGDTITIRVHEFEGERVLRIEKVLPRRFRSKRSQEIFISLLRNIVDWRFDQ